MKIFSTYFILGQYPNFAPHFQNDSMALGKQYNANSIRLEGVSNNTAKPPNIPFTLYLVSSPRKLK